MVKSVYRYRGMQKYEESTPCVDLALTLFCGVFFSSELPCYDLIVPALLKGDIKGLQESCKLTPGKI